MQYSRGHDTKYADDDVFIKILFRVYPIMLMKSHQVFFKPIKNTDCESLYYSARSIRFAKCRLAFCCYAKTTYFVGLKQPIKLQ